MAHINNDITYKQLQSGMDMSNFAVVINSRTCKGEQETCFIDVKCWGNVAKLVNDTMKKGATVIIEGRLGQESYDYAAAGGTQRRFKHIITADSVKLTNEMTGVNPQQGTITGEYVCMK